MTPADRDVAVALAREIAFEAARLLNDAYHHGHKRKEAADRLNVIARAVLALAERPTCDWQPIETAPKHGGVVYIGAHINHRGINSVQLCAGDWSDRLTHWMALPPAPLPSCSICRRDDCGGDHPCE